MNPSSTRQTSTRSTTPMPRGKRKSAAAMDVNEGRSSRSTKKADSSRTSDERSTPSRKKSSKSRRTSSSLKH